MHDFTGYLYALPSFAEGMARVLDIGGTMTRFNEALTPEQADDLAFAADLCALEEDLQFAVNQVLAPVLTDGTDS